MRGVSFIKRRSLFIEESLDVVWVVAMAMDVVVAATVVAAMDVPVTEAMDVAAGLPPLHINERHSLSSV